MPVIIPDPRFEMPGLFEPGVNPPENVVLDISHPITQHIDFANSSDLGLWLPYGKRNLNILKNTSPTSFIHNFINNYNFLPRSFETNGTNTLHHKSISNIVNNRLNWTQIIDVIRLDSEDGGIIMVNEDVFNTLEDRGLYFNTSNNLAGFLFDGSQGIATSTSTYIDGDRVTAVLTADGSNLKLFVNGNKEATINISNNGFDGFTTPELIINHNVGKGGYGKHRYLMYGMFYGALPEALAISITRNPYQFLIPA